MRGLSIFLIAVLFLAAGASGQYLGQMSPASILKAYTGKIGGYFAAGDEANLVVGSLCYAFSDYMEGRFRMGMIDEEGKNTDPHLVVGFDGKYSLWKYGTSGSTYNNPFDLALGFGAEFAELQHESHFGIGCSAIGSIPYRLKNNSVIEPYARLNLRYEYVDEDDYWLEDRHHPSDSYADIEVGLNIGALFSVTPLVDFTAELQLDNQLAFMLGVDFAAF